MEEKKLIWLASYPRSGNTLLRTVLWHCFALPSASVYPGDLKGNEALERHVGHIEHDAAGQIPVPAGPLRLVKTHEQPVDWQPAIYVVRDGRAVCVSLWEFYGRSLDFASIVAGKHQFGSWSSHLSAWQPWRRPETLLVTYEELAGDLPSALAKLSRFLDRKPVAQQIPDRDDVASADGRHVRKCSDWRPKVTDEQLELFDRVNGEMMIQMGYKTR